MRVYIACLRLRLLILFSSDFRVSDKKRLSDLSVGMLDFQLISDLTCWRRWLTASKKELVFVFLQQLEHREHDANAEETHVYALFIANRTFSLTKF